MGLTGEKKKRVIEDFGKDQKDTGSASVQVALLTERINDLTAHLDVHKKDFNSQRGLRKMVGQRRRLLKYLKHCDLSAYRDLIQKLDIRGI
jgi:small subunit ribosomal protein S15